VCQVFHNADAYLSAFHVLHPAGVDGAVKKSAAFVIVNVVPDIREPLSSGIAFQKDFLGLNLTQE